MAEVLCEACGRKYRVTGRNAGRRALCRCGAVFTVPAGPVSGGQHFLVGAGDPHHLTPGETLRIGRGEDNDIVLATDGQVSRHHAELRWDGDACVLHDLGSANGTLVAGRRVQSLPLAQNTEFAIGGTTFTYRIIVERDEVNTEFILKEVQQRETAVMVQSVDGDFSGRLDTVDVREICQMLHVGCRCGQLVIVHDGGRRATLGFEDGEIQCASSGHLAGDEAALRILRIAGGTFAFHANWHTTRRDVSLSTAKLLLEAARQDDEG